MIQDPEGSLRILKALLQEGLMTYEVLSSATGLSPYLCQMYSETLCQQGLVKIMPFGRKELKGDVVVLLTPQGKVEAAKLTLGSY